MTILYGCMQDEPLLISMLIDYAADNHPNREIVSKMPDGSVHRYGYAEARSRSKRLAKALIKHGIQMSDRVGTLANNSYRHFECFYGISGIGAVMNTVNPRLFDTQIKYIISHAENRIMFVDLQFVELAEKLSADLPSVEKYVIFADSESMPETTLTGAMSYEDFIADEDDELEWPSFEERAASSLCYTSGTTGNPKGVLYSHRSTILHALHAAQPSVLNIGPTEKLLVIAPMYHANAWSTPYLAPLAGASLVLPGDDLGAENLHNLILTEKTTFACAVPTVWTTTLEYVDAKNGNLGELKRAAIAGVTVPPSMIEYLREKHGVSVLQFWGMTEMSPIATISSPVPALDDLDNEERLKVLCKQGRIAFGVKLKIVDAEENRLPRDGKSFGDILGKGPWIANGYFRGEGGDVLDSEGYLPTGDVGFMDEYGYLKLTDRSKDVIKSGGEWISSVDLENAILSHPAIREAAVVGVYHPKWDERPLLIVSFNKGATATKEELMEHLKPQVAKWWLPDDIEFVDTLPYTATGKIRKVDLRNQYIHHLHKP